MRKMMARGVSLGPFHIEFDYSGDFDELLRSPERFQVSRRGIRVPILGVSRDAEHRLTIHVSETTQFPIDLRNYHRKGLCGLVRMKLDI